MSWKGVSHRHQGRKRAKNGVRGEAAGFPQCLGCQGPLPPQQEAIPLGTLQISTLLAASSISSLRASALAPEGCRLLAKPEDLADCCHLQRGQRCLREGNGDPRRAVAVSQRTWRAAQGPPLQPSPPWSPGLSTMEVVPAQAGLQHPLPTLNIPSPHNHLHALGSN